MSNPYVGEIRLFAGNFAPVGWAMCNGQLMAISSNVALFSLIGTLYGGDGQITFALPDLRGRVPVHQGLAPGLQSYVIGEVYGPEQVTLTTGQMAQHRHAMNAADVPASPAVARSALLAHSTAAPIYGDPTVAPLTMATGAIGPQGGSQPHDNMAPSLTLSFIISLFGIFPSQS